MAVDKVFIDVDAVKLNMRISHDLSLVIEVLDTEEDRFAVFMLPEEDESEFLAEIKQKLEEVQRLREADK